MRTQSVPLRSPSFERRRGKPPTNGILAPSAAPEGGLTLLARLTVCALAVGGLTSAVAQAKAPSRVIPAAVLAEVDELDQRFRQALALDCPADLCFSKGCSYVDHAVADQPRSASLPGLGEDVGPGGLPPQEFLTRARCSYAHEASLSQDDVSALSGRLESKLSGGFRSVGVDAEVLPPMPALGAVAEPSGVEAPAPPPPPPPWTLATAARELWLALLPHAGWLAGAVVATAALLTLVWGWRRIGRLSPEEQALMAELGRGEASTQDPGAQTAAAPGSDAAFVAEERARWAQRLVDPRDGRATPQAEVLAEALLHAEDRALLAKALLTFPDALGRALPEGGPHAQRKLQLFDGLRGVDPATLPSDAEFFRALQGYAAPSALAAQDDARRLRTLHAEVGARGLADLVTALPPRLGAILFAMATARTQREVARLLPSSTSSLLAEALLLSNRMDPAEAHQVVVTLEALRRGEPPTPAVAPRRVTDRGQPLEAAPALCVLLEHASADERQRLLAEALGRGRGAFPTWYRELFVSDMLEVLPEEARVDLLLEVEPDALAAWLAGLEPTARAALLRVMPSSLRASVEAAPPPVADLAERGRAGLAAAFQRQLARSGLRFESVVRAEVHEEATHA